MSTPRNLRAIPLAGNTATGALKLIALCFMMIDHMGKMLFPQVPEMRILGRIAFPLYAWCMVVGFHYTRNPWRYSARVLSPPWTAAISPAVWWRSGRGCWKWGAKRSRLWRKGSKICIKA